MNEKTQLIIDYLKLKLHVNMDNSFEEALQLTQDSKELRTETK